MHYSPFSSTLSCPLTFSLLQHVTDMPPHQVLCLWLQARQCGYNGHAENGDETSPCHRQVNRLLVLMPVAFSAGFCHQADQDGGFRGGTEGEGGSTGDMQGRA